MVAWGPIYIYISNSIIICIGCTNKQYCIMIIWNNKTNNIIQTLFIYKYDIHIYQKDNKIVMGILYGIYPSKVRITCVFIYFLGWWWLEPWNFMTFHSVGNVIIPTDFHSIIFQKGFWSTTKQYFSNHFWGYKLRYIWGFYWQQK